ncbi:exodeoxyribonuclease VII large subunit [Aquibacillus halophilus]|uniref:Exodeoxyribonuclease 7 large subunit n=1 Tax=Aquibacillus halophilus TaxID=930132 RepID=A0A6A8DD53_9BACI|nr:exodeoxyribonuclease VII large subunit [Aquibacillus halophilus]MRH43170.1 exodeoxyribonuclease VII large subunit [Aquibacillus halophilus]
MNEKYLTVSALTKYIKRKFELDNHLKEVWLKGEISNFKHHSRGHMYLTIKDDHSRVQAVMFAGNNRFMKFKPENGMNVLIKGEINIYEPQGQYQLYIQQMEPDGIGALYLAFEQLKEKLSKEGLFDQSKKKPIPKFPRHIGVVTSPTGAAVKDILTTIRRRYPIVKVTVIPVLVQGDYAATSIVKAIDFSNSINEFDVLIVGRGGGSIEELWSFNEEIVARAISSSNIPIISAVGHETDFTISDFVADLRAATPTAAAELAVPSQEELKEKLISLRRSLSRLSAIKLTTTRERLEQLRRSYAFRYPAQLLQQKEQELDKQVDNLTKTMIGLYNKKNEQRQHLLKRLGQQHPEKQLQQLKKQVNQLTLRNQHAFKNEFQSLNNKFDSTLEKLTILNPLTTMKRGYSVSYSQQGTVIRSSKQVEPGEQITVKLYNGSLDCQVWGIEEEKEND